LLLPDGRVLSAGGGHIGTLPSYYSAEIYSPPYLFKGPRPTITSAPDSVPYGTATFTVDSPEVDNIASVSLIALASVTHSIDMNQFYTELSFTKGNGQLSISAPQNGDQVPGGYYMLFIVDKTGVPSVARIMKIGSATVSTPPPPPPSTTIGLTSKGSVLDSGSSNHLNGSKVTASNGGTISSMSVYVGGIDALSGNQSYQLAIYTDNAGKPGTLVASSATGTLTANSWNTLPIAATLQPNTSYWLMYNTNGRTSTVNNMYYNNGTVGQGVFSSSGVTFGTWPATFPASQLSRAIYSLYATFEP